MELTTMKNMGVYLTSWFDNKVVTVASSHLAANPISQAKRYNRAEREKINIPGLPLLHTTTTAWAALIFFTATLHNVEQLSEERNGTFPSCGTCWILLP